MERFYFVMVVDGAEFDESNYEDKLYEAGCDDALVTVIDSIIKVEFEREGETFHDAVYSAVKDVTKAGGKVCKIERFVNREDGRRDIPAYQPIQRVAS